MTRKFRELQPTGNTVYRTPKGYYAIRLHTDAAHARAGESYWLIIRGWGDSGGWSWYRDEDFTPAPDVREWAGRSGGSYLNVVLPIGVAPRQEWLDWSPEGWNGDGPWPLPDEIPPSARQIVPNAASSIYIRD